jgi:thiol-disulfide isomerase/thioredoxin
MNAVVIGPLVFAPDRFAAILAIAAFLLLSEILARKIDSRISGWSGGAIIAFIVGARAGHVIRHGESFLAEPLRALYIWQGGFLIWSGVALAAAYTLIRFRRELRVVLWVSLPVAVSAAFVGEPLVVNLWASWCPPCRREMPMMADVAANTGEARLVFVNQGEGADIVRNFLNAENLDLDHVVLDSLGEFGRHYGAPGLPATFFIGRDGTLRSVHMGEISREALTSGIDRLAGDDKAGEASAH